MRYEGCGKITKEGGYFRPGILAGLLELFEILSVIVVVNLQEMVPEGVFF